MVAALQSGSTEQASVDWSDWKTTLQLAKVSAILSATDAADLRWYFRSGGLDRFIGSTMAAMLARAEMFAYTSKPCERCGGDPKRWTAGSGFECTKAKGRKPTEYEAALLRLLELNPGDLLPPAGDKVCRDCEGHGWIFRTRRSNSTAPLTARPMGSSIKSKMGASVEIDGGDMARLGLVTRRIQGARQHDQRAPDVLAAYYSPGGEAPLALWHLTTVGKTMLRGNGLKLPIQQFFANERVRQEEQPTAKRKAQFEEADNQARELLRAVCHAWNVAKAGQ